MYRGGEDDDGFGDGVPVCVGYRAVIAGKRHRCQSFAALLRVLQRDGAVRDGKAVLVSAGGMDSLAELEARVAFERLDMAGILERYRGVADSFELVNPDFGSAVTTAEAEEAAEGVRRDTDSLIGALYEGLSDERKARLPSLSALCGDIRAEFEAAVPVWGYAAAQSFMDRVMDGEAAYAADDFAQRVYLETVLSRGRLERLREQAAPDFPPDRLLDLPEYNALAPALIRERVAFSWHCGESEDPVRIYRFRLTEGSEAWLRRHRTDYDLCGELRFLALYRGEALLFSSDTDAGRHAEFPRGE